MIECRNFFRGALIALAAIGVALIAWMMMRHSDSEPRRPHVVSQNNPKPSPTAEIPDRPRVAMVGSSTPAPTPTPVVLGSIGGVVVTTDEKPVAGADVRAMIGEKEAASARSNEAGVFKLERLPLTSYTADGQFTVDSISATLRCLTFNIMKKNVYSGAFDFTGSIDLPAHKAGDTLNLGDVALKEQKK